MRWRRYFERNRRDRELAQEIAHYVAQETEDNVARGMNPTDARLAALRRFGNRQSVRETVYSMKRVNWLEVVLPGPEIRPPAAPAAPWLRRGGDRLARAWHRRQHRDLHARRIRSCSACCRSRSLTSWVRLRLDGVRPGGNWGDGTHTFPIRPVALRDRSTCSRA